MKKILSAVIMICFIAAAYTSCKKDNLSTPTQTIVGKWSMKNAIGHYIVLSNERRDTTNFNSLDYFNFKTDGTLSIVESDVSYNGNWQITNNKLFR